MWWSGESDVGGTQVLLQPWLCPHFSANAGWLYGFLHHVIIIKSYGVIKLFNFSWSQIAISYMFIRYTWQTSYKHSFPDGYIPAGSRKLRSCPFLPIKYHTRWRSWRLSELGLGFQSIIAPGNDGILQFDLRGVRKLYPSGGLHYIFPERKMQR